MNIFANEGKNIGLITNHSAIDRSFKPTIDKFLENKELSLKAIFSPEHGIDGDIYGRIVRLGPNTKVLVVSEM